MSQHKTDPVRSTALVGGLICFAIMLLISFSALGRFIFQRPIDGTLELTEAAMPFIIFFGVAATETAGHNIKMSSLVRRMRPRWQRRLVALNHLLGTILCAAASVATMEAALLSFEVHEVSYGALEFPIYPSKFAITVGCLMLTFVFLRKFVHALRNPIVIEGD